MPFSSWSLCLFRYVRAVLLVYCANWIVLPFSCYLNVYLYCWFELALYLFSLLFHCYNIILFRCIVLITLRPFIYCAAIIIIIVVDCVWILERVSSFPLLNCVILIHPLCVTIFCAVPVRMYWRCFPYWLLFWCVLPFWLRFDRFHCIRCVGWSSYYWTDWILICTDTWFLLWRGPSCITMGGSVNIVAVVTCHTAQFRYRSVPSYCWINTLLTAFSSVHFATRHELRFLLFYAFIILFSRSFCCLLPYCCCVCVYLPVMVVLSTDWRVERTFCAYIVLILYCIAAVRTIPNIILDAFSSIALPYVVTTSRLPLLVCPSPVVHR